MTEQVQKLNDAIPLMTTEEIRTTLDKIHSEMSRRINEKIDKFEAKYA